MIYIFLLTGFGLRIYIVVRLPLKKLIHRELGKEREEGGSKWKIRRGSLSKWGKGEKFCSFSGFISENKIIFDLVKL